MPLTPTQARTAQAIVNLFETGRVLGDYSQVTLIAGDTGQLTYGRSQATLGSGNLHKLLERYCANAGARFGARLTRWLPKFAAGSASLNSDLKLHNLLRACADDRVMRDTQDTFFDEYYFEPAVRAATALHISSPLGVTVVYDSFVHGSWARIRDRVPGSPPRRSEKRWITDYVAARRDWLARHSRSDLRPTVYRMDALRRLIELGQWGLELPLVVRGAEISELTLNATPSGCYDGPAPGSRALGLQSGTPLPRGLDVRRLQLGLSDKGADIRADGVFGQASALHVKAYQKAHRLPATGIADIALIMRLAA